MAQSNPALALTAHFANLPDPRIDRTRRHELLDIVVIAVCAVIAGAEGWKDMAEYGRAKQTWLRTFLALPHGIPCADTFRRVFSALQPAAFLTCFQSWIDALSAGLGLKRIAIDGKTLRRSFDRATGQAALHLVSAWATEQHLVLGQVAVDAKSNEITAIPKLLEMLDVSGAMVTIDAMGCQTKIAAKIREGGGHYVLSVKENQEHLLADIQQCFVAGLDTNFKGMEHTVHEEEYRGHGRMEQHTVHTILRPAGIRGQENWTDLTAITLVISQRQEGSQKPTEETRYYIGSKAASAKVYTNCIRGHWGIENGLHWVLDVSFDEDQSRIRKDHGPENMGLLRRLAVSLLKQQHGKNSVRGKRLRSGWDDRFLVEVLGGK